MDQKLIGWARAVKSRMRHRPGPPPLWLFTDTGRIADPVAAAARLPKGLCGVVLRDDDRPDRAALARRLARVCRQRRLVLVVAGDWRLAQAVRAGIHLRGGRGRVTGRVIGRVTGRCGFGATASVHDGADLRRAARRGVGLAFVSPVFPTLSHPGAPVLGAVRLGVLVRRSKMPIAALGGIDGVSIKRLGWRVGAAAAIGALL